MSVKMIAAILIFEVNVPDVVRPISGVAGVKSDRLFLISIAFVSSSKRLILSAVASSKP